MGGQPISDGNYGVGVTGLSRIWVDGNFLNTLMLNSPSGAHGVRGHKGPLENAHNTSIILSSYSKLLKVIGGVSQP